MENVSGLVLSPAKGQKLLIDLYFEPLSPPLICLELQTPEVRSSKEGNILYMG